VELVTPLPLDDDDEASVVIDNDNDGGCDDDVVDDELVPTADGVDVELFEESNGSDAADDVNDAIFILLIMNCHQIVSVTNSLLWLSHYPYQH
jgi:hypothetical protein